MPDDKKKTKAELLKELERVRASEQRYRHIVENQRDLIVIFDHERRIQYASPQYCRTFGKTLNELLSSDFMPLVHEDDQERVKKSLKKLLHPPYECTHQERVETVDGFRWYDWRYKALVDDEEKITEIVAAGRDITDWKEPGEWFTAFMHEFPGVAFIKDNNLRHLYVNPHLENLFNLSQEDWLNKSNRELFPDFAEEFDRNDRNALEQGKTIQTVELVRANGQEQHWLVTKFPIYRVSDSSPLLGGLGINITKQKQYEEELLEKEMRLQLSLEAANAGTWILDLTSDKVFLDGHMQELFGLKPGTTETTGDFWISLLHPDDVNKATDESARALGGDGSYDLECRIKGVDDTWRHIMTQGMVVRDGTDTPQKIVGLSIDITERKRIEKLVNEQKNLLDSILNSTTDMFFLKDREGVTRAVNPAFCQYLNMREEEILGKTNYELFPREYADIYTRDDNEVMEKGIRLVNDEEGSAPGGAKRWFRVLKNPVYGDDGEIWGVIVLLSDITERKNTEEALKKSESKYKDLLNQAPVMLHSIDKKGRLLNVSDMWLDVMGYKRDEVLGRKSIEFITEKSQREAVEKNLPNLFRTGIAKNVPNQFIRKNGEVMDVLVSARCEYDDRGEVLRTFAAITDITELRKAEEALIAHQEKLRKLTSEMAFSEERQRRAIARELHDQVGQNLSTAKLRLLQLKKLDGDDKFRDIIEEVTGTIDRAIQDTRSLTFELSPPVLYELGLEEALEWLADEMEEKHGVRFTVLRNQEKIDLDENMQIILFQVARELVVNVIKHASAREARLSLSLNDSNIVLEVWDDGRGFSSELIGEVGAEEMGFGIFNIRERISLLGGTMNIKSTGGISTTVTVTIPHSQTVSEMQDDAH